LSGKNVAQGTQFLAVDYKVYADIRRGSLERIEASNVSVDCVVVENGDFRFYRSLSSEHFTYMATRQILRDASVDDLGDISRSLDCFTSNFSRTVCDTAKVTILCTNGKSYTSFRLVPLLMTLKYI